MKEETVTSSNELYWPTGDDEASKSRRLAILQEVLLKKNHEGIRTILQNGADVHEWYNIHPFLWLNPAARHLGARVHPKDRMQMIHMACSLKWLPGVEEIILAGAEINSFDYKESGRVFEESFSYTPLMHACASCNLPLVKLLLKHGADVSLRDPIFNDTAMRRAMTYYNIFIIMTLLEYGATIGPREVENLKIVELTETFHTASKLIPRGLRLSATEQESMAAEVRSTALRLLQARLDYGGKPNNIPKGELQMPPLFIAIKFCQHDLRCFELLFNYGADINLHCDGSIYFEYFTVSPLLACVLFDKSEDVTSWLIQHGANVNDIFQKCHRGRNVGEPQTLLEVTLEHGLSLSKCIKNAQMLLHAGSVVTPGCLDLMRTMQRECEDIQKSYFEETGLTEPTLSSNIEIIKDMIDLCLQPKSLKWLVRTSLRNSNGLTDKQAIDSLPLPKAMKTYLSCGDL